MLFWAIDNPAPANYLLISGDRDFSNALHRLSLRRYNILLAQPQNASAPLIAAAKNVWRWTSLVAGGPALPPDEDTSGSDESIPENTQSGNRKVHRDAKVENKHKYKQSRKPSTQRNQPRPFLNGAKQSVGDKLEHCDPENLDRTNQKRFPINQQHTHATSSQLSGNGLDASVSSFPQPPATGMLNTEKQSNAKPTSSSLSHQHVHMHQGKLHEGFVDSKFKATASPSNLVVPPPLSLFQGANHHVQNNYPNCYPGDFMVSTSSFNSANMSQPNSYPHIPPEQRPWFNAPSYSTGTPTSRSELANTLHDTHIFQGNMAPRPSVVPDANITTSRDPHRAQQPVHGVGPKPSNYDLALVGTVILALNSLKEDMIVPTETNIADCIHYGKDSQPTFDVRRGVACALELQKIVMQKAGGLHIYVPKGQLMWKCLNLIDTNVKNAKAKCAEVQKFLTSPSGRATVMASPAR